MKKPLLITTTLVVLALSATSIYAQVTTGTSIVDKMKAAAHSFTLSSVLNPTETGLTSEPIKGKKAGGILTAGEWNRVLELLGEGGGGGASGSGWESVSPSSDTADFDTECLYEVQLKTTDATNNNLMNGDTTWRAGTIRGNKYLGLAFTDGSGSNYTVFGIRSTNKNVFGYRDGSGTFTPVTGVSVLGIRRLCGGGGSSGSGPALYKCTNAQSLDTTNAPCYGASRNGGAGTNQYRVVSCSNTDASGTYTAGGLLNFGDFIANKWSFHINNSNIACTDGSVLVMGIQGGGSGGGAGWEDVSLTDTADFDKACEYRYQMLNPPDDPYMGNDPFRYIIAVDNNRLTWLARDGGVFHHINSDSKTVYRVNGAPIAYFTISKLQKRCGGGGGPSSTPSNLVYINPENTDFAPLDCTPGVNYMITPIAFNAASASTYTDKKLAILKSGNWRARGTGFVRNRNINPDSTHTFRFNSIIDSVTDKLFENTVDTGIYASAFSENVSVPAGKTAEINVTVRNNSIYGGSVAVWCLN